MFVKIHSPQMPSKMLPFFHLYTLTLQVVIFVTYIFFLKVRGYIIQLTFVAFYVHELDTCQSLCRCSLQRGSVATRWDCGFESCQWHGCLFLMSAVCFAGTVPALGQSLIQRILPNVCVSPTATITSSPTMSGRKRSD